MTNKDFSALEQMSYEYGKYFDNHEAKYYGNGLMKPYKITYKECARRKFVVYCMAVRPNLKEMYLRQRQRR